MTPPNLDPTVTTLVAFYENLTRQDLPQLHRLYAPDATFKDPFNEVRGVAAIEEIFRHMFDSLSEPHFKVHTRIVQGSDCFLSWDFHYRLARMGPDWQTIRGGTHLVFTPEGQVSLHRDYWDAAEELYEKIPLLGALMRWLKRQINQN